MRETRNLDFGWRIRKYPNDGETTSDWMAADMPAQVHEVLLAHGLLEDPREFRGSEKCQWVADYDWKYELDFEFIDNGACRQTLLFEGVDTLAEFYLNGEMIGEHFDQYLPARFDVTAKLQSKNVLSSRFPQDRESCSPLSAS